MATNKPRAGENIPLEPYTKGMISNSSHYVLDTGSWSYLENFHDDKSGVIRSRSHVQEAATTTNGYQGVGFLEDGSGNRIFIKSGVDLLITQPESPGTITTIAGFFVNASSVARFNQIQSVMVIVSPGMIPKIVDKDGTLLSTVSFSSSSGIVCAGFSGRIWSVPAFNGTSPTRKTDEIYYTDVLPQDLSVSVVTGGSDYLKINTRGKSLTALIEENNTMYAFTNDSLFRVYNTQSQDNAPIANVGTFRQESVVRTPGGIFFIGNSGIYRLGDSPEKISTPIDDFFYKMNILRTSETDSSSSGYPKNALGWYDDTSVYFSVQMDNQHATTGSPSLSYPDRTYVIRYNYLKGSFSIYTYYGVTITCAGTNNFSVNLNNETFSQNPFVLLGARLTDGTAHRLGYVPRPYYRGNKPLQALTNLSDWGSTRAQPIFLHAETQWLTFGMENKAKKITGISVASSNGAGLNLYYQIDNEGDDNNFDNGTWELIGTLKDKYITFFRSFNSKAFYRIKFKISGSTTGKPIEVGQITFLSVEDKGYGE